MSGRAQPEALARVRIDNILKRLGWRFEGPGRNVTVDGETKNPDHKSALNRKRPDYILYYEGSEIPVGVIEAKKPKHGNLAGALKQAAQYARLLGGGKMVAFATDGAITLTSHVQQGGPLTINGEVVNELLPPLETMELANDPDLKLGKDIRSINELIRFFKDSNKHLRDDGIETGISSLEQFCLVLFVKIMASKKGPHKNDWKSLVEENGSGLLAKYNEIVEKYRRRFSDMFPPVEIKNPATLERLVFGINRINLQSASMDIKGGAYEYFLAKYSSGNKSELGQYFTPRHITKLMARLVSPNPGETIYDPFCGTGGMLISCYEFLVDKIEGDNKEARRILDKETLFGRDTSPTMSRLAKMNMVILGDGSSNIERGDSLAIPAFQKYDIVITNFPFNLKKGVLETTPEMRKFGLHKETPLNPNDACLRACMYAVKPGGKAAIVVPENMAYDSTYAGLRAFIMDNAKIKAVVRLPRAVFNNYASARTFILLLENVWEGETHKFPFVEIKNDGYSHAKPREPITENDLPRLYEAADDFKGYKSRSRGEHCLFFDEASAQTDICENHWELKDLLVLRTDKIELDANKIYFEPRIQGKSNTITPCKERLGRNVRSKKVISRKGDLIISRLHTQNNLFAYCDREYMVTSQICGKVRENIVNKIYLAHQLRRVLPTMSKDDLTGRETYSAEEILSIKIPKCDDQTDAAYRQYEDSIKSAEDELQKFLQKREKSKK